MSTIILQAHIHNDLGLTVAAFWAAHRPTSSSTPDTQFGGTLKQGDDGSNFNITIESSTTDSWTVMWTDTNNNLFGSTLWFQAEVFSSGGNVEIQLQGSGSAVEILQGAKTLGTSKIQQYGWGGSANR